MPKTQREIAREVDEILRSGASGRGGAGARSRVAFEKHPHRAHATKKDYDWNSFIDGAAFAFWASPYMTAVENLAEQSREAPVPKKAEALRAAYDALSPGAGGQWESVLPETPAAARAVAKKFARIVKRELTAQQLSDIAEKFSPYDAGYKGAMQSQGEGIGWFDEGVSATPPRDFNWDPKVQNAVARAVAKGARDAGIKLPRQ